MPRPVGGEGKKTCSGFTVSNCSVDDPILHYSLLNKHRWVVLEICTLRSKTLIQLQVKPLMLKDLPTVCVLSTVQFPVIKQT